MKVSRQPQPTWLWKTWKEGRVVRDAAWPRTAEPCRALSCKSSLRRSEAWYMTQCQTRRPELSNRKPLGATIFRLKCEHRAGDMAPPKRLQSKVWNARASCKSLPSMLGFSLALPFAMHVQAKRWVKVSATKMRGTTCKCILSNHVKHMSNV